MLRIQIVGKSMKIVYTTQQMNVYWQRVKGALNCPLKAGEVLSPCKARAMSERKT
jgi:hypothetical protein